jgi:predicted NAD/FAD-dependent oxidoreductase
MISTEFTTDVLVIGAGIAGLIAAAELQRAGRSIRVLDKGRGVGGRLASRRIEGVTFDHGAQCFALADPFLPNEALLPRLRDALVKWGPRTLSHCSWRGTPSMSAIPKHLAQGLDVRLEMTVTALRPDGDRWSATIASGTVFSAGAVVLTPPVPQALALLDAGGVALGPAVRSRLTAIEYDRCLAVMALLDGPSRIPPPGGIAPASGPIAWITDNVQKGIASEPSVTLHATPAFSLEHWDRDRQESGQLLLEAGAAWLGAGVRTFQVHGWRYSQSQVANPDRCLVVGWAPLLVLAGDAFGSGGVEGAALSGMAAAEAILSR